ncbi:hypothetical protein ACFL2H_13330, partial [Planctomycetota bacterium]
REHHWDQLEFKTLDGYRYVEKGEDEFFLSFPETKRYFICLWNGQGGEAANRYTMTVSTVEDSTIPIAPNLQYEYKWMGRKPRWYSVPLTAGKIYEFPTKDVFESDGETSLGLSEPNQRYHTTEDRDIRFFLKSRSTRITTHRFTVTEFEDVLADTRADATAFELPFTISDQESVHENDWISYPLIAGRKYTSTFETFDLESHDRLSSQTSTWTAEETELVYREFDIRDDVRFRFSVFETYDESSSLENAVQVRGPIIEGLFTDRFDIDWYALEVEKGQIFDEHTFQTMGVRTVKVLDSHLNDASSSVVPANGTYFIGVQGNQSEPYSIRLVTGQERRSAGTLDQSESSVGQLESALQSDVYFFETNAGQAYELRRSAGSSQFQISDSQGAFVRHGDELATWRSRTFRWIATADETVSISVANISRPVTPKYTLKVETPYGDANLDGVFDSGDFVRVFSAGEYEDDIDGNSTWSEGDWDGDGDFTSSDLVKAFTNGNYVTGVQPPIAAQMRTRAGDVAFRLMEGDGFTFDTDQELSNSPNGGHVPNDPSKRRPIR